MKLAVGERVFVAVEAVIDGTAEFQFSDNSDQIPYATFDRVSPTSGWVNGVSAGLSQLIVSYDVNLGPSVVPVIAERYIEVAAAGYPRLALGDPEPQ